MINPIIRSLALITLALSCATSTKANSTPDIQATATTTSTAATETSPVTTKKISIEENTTLAMKLARYWAKIKKHYKKDVEPMIAVMAPIVIMMAAGHILGIATGITPDLTRAQISELSTLEACKYAAPMMAGQAAGAALTFALI